MVFKIRHLLQKKADCIVRESNPGRPRGRRAFYHWTNDAVMMKNRNRGARLLQPKRGQTPNCLSERLIQGKAAMAKQCWRKGSRRRSQKCRVGHPFFSKERFVLYVLFHSVQKNDSFSTFFSVQYKRTFCSLRSFFVCKKNVSFIFRTFRSIFEFFLAFLGVKSGFISLQKLKNRTKRLKNERNVHLCSFPFILIINNLFNYFLGFISREKHKKWTEKNVLF